MFECDFLCVDFLVEQAAADRWDYICECHDLDEMELYLKYYDGPNTPPTRGYVTCPECDGRGFICLCPECDLAHADCDDDDDHEYSSWDARSGFCDHCDDTGYVEYSNDHYFTPETCNCCKGSGELLISDMEEGL